MNADYYAVLGIEPEADLETIKVQYRQLVREHHPDIAPDKAAANIRMAEILEAWRTLSDPEKRARYDAERRLAAQRSGGARLAEPVVPRSSRTTAAPSSSSRYPARRSTRTSNAKARMLEQVNRAAHLYFREGRAGESVALCQRVLKSDPKNVEATILLGDIYAAQGKGDMALVMFDRALLLQPGNVLVRSKREKIRPFSRQDAAWNATQIPTPPGPPPRNSFFDKLKAKFKG
jgi:curved DNA-binding protein CbpA